jgi:hypothetical protein
MDAKRAFGLASSSMNATIHNAFLSAVALLVAACAQSGTDTGPEQNSALPAPAAAPQSNAEAKAVAERTDLIEFSYAWPAAASAIPALNARLETELATDRNEALAIARDDKDARAGQEYPFNGHYFRKEWTVEGETPALLSLTAEVETFTGGAHGNQGYDSILWDRRAGQAIAFGDMFTSAPAALETLTKAFCPALDKARAEKRQETLPLKGDDWMTTCPDIGKQTLAPVDENKDGRFETLRVLIAPYEAGPYAEGSYEIDIAVTSAIRSLMKRDYADMFRDSLSR